jgi:anhydro-N-acetylmuramic acid kinase
VIVLALASGTSADAVDVAAAEIRWATDDPRVVELTPLAAYEEPWPDGLRARLLALLPPAPTTAAQVCALDTAVGQALGAAAARALAGPAAGAELVVSPGQTVHHEVAGGRCLGTLQLGQPAWLVEATGLPVVADLRARDVAAGGHGAPLASALDALWLGGDGTRRAALNLGGIANVTVVDGTGGVTAWDTGPASCLLDLAAARVSDGTLTCDRDGALAASGAVRDDLLEVLLAAPYYALPAPKSTGRELFSAEHLDAALAQVPPVAPPDLLATLTELTAVTVADALAPHRVDEVVASGGGTRNPALMAALRRRLDGVPVVPSDARGLPSDAKEAYLWTLLGFLAWHGVPAPAATGAPRRRVLGRISPGDAPLSLPAPAPAPPSRLRVLDGGPR